MTDEDIYYHIGIHSDHQSGGGSGKGYYSSDESSASSYYQEQIDSSGVIAVEMVLYRYVNTDLAESIVVKEWKKDEC